MKFLSQNFLIDGNIVRKIVKFAEVKKGDSILEIGPGPGALTEELLAQGASVIAVEKDRKFAAALHRLQTADQRLQIFENDVLKWNPTSHLNFKTKLIANLPYNITTPILTHFLPQRKFFQSLTVMVQREVGERVIAKPGSKAYGSL
ncbi:MAG: ribosomal RNA small subunit methyltransferase A, partial [Rhabdochlamydiaceae bacterium]